MKLIRIEIIIVLIDNLGRVIKISPSHMSTLEKLAAEKRNISVEELQNSATYNERLWWIEYLTKETNSIIVWYGFQKYYGHINKFQKRTLSILHKEGLIELNLIRFNDIIEY